MNKSYFCSERVRLRAMEPEDLEVMYAMDAPCTGEAPETASASG